LTDLFDIFLRSCSNSSKDLNLHRLNGSLFSSVYSLTLQSRIFARDFPQSCLDISHQLALIRLVNDFMLLILNCRGLDTFFISPSFVSTSYSPLLWFFSVTHVFNLILVDSPDFSCYTRCHQPSLSTSMIIIIRSLFEIIINSEHTKKHFRSITRQWPIFLA
jgi:hypothetical protein